jgi:hypothetical protein
MDSKIELKLQRLLKKNNKTIDKYTGNIIDNCPGTARREALRTKLLMKIMKKQTTANST